jgi:hypothetical protein
MSGSEIDKYDRDGRAILLTSIKVMSGNIRACGGAHSYANEAADTARNRRQGD